METRDPIFSEATLKALQGPLSQVVTTFMTEHKTASEGARALLAIGGLDSSELALALAALTGPAAVARIQAIEPTSGLVRPEAQEYLSEMLREIEAAAAGADTAFESVEGGARVQDPERVVGWEPGGWFVPDGIGVFGQEPPRARAIEHPEPTDEAIEEAFDSVETALVAEQASRMAEEPPVPSVGLGVFGQSSQGLREHEPTSASRSDPELAVIEQILELLDTRLPPDGAPRVLRYLTGRYGA